MTGREMLVRTRRAVKAGEELNITYDDLAEASWFRRQRLQQQFFFDPAPGGVGLPQSALDRDAIVTKVFTRSAGNWLAVEPGLAWNAELGVCALGSSSQHADAAASWLRGLHVRWQRLSNEVDATAKLAGFRDFWESFWGVARGRGARPNFKLGVGHTFGLHVARAAMDAAVDASSWEEAAVWARRVCASEEAIFGSSAQPWPVPASSLARLAKLELYLGWFAAARDAAKKALAIFGSLGVTGGNFVEELTNIMGQAEAEDCCREQAVEAIALQRAEEEGFAARSDSVRCPPVAATQQDAELASFKLGADAADFLNAMD